MDNFRFSTLEYKRPDLDAYRAKLKDWKAAIEHAESYEALRTLLLEMDRENCELSTQYSIANIRHTLNTRDEFYETEVAYLDDTLPTLGGEEVALSEAIASSPFRPDIEKEFGKQYFVSMDLQKKLFCEANIPLRQQESRLTNEYQKIMATAEIFRAPRPCHARRCRQGLRQILRGQRAASGGDLGRADPHPQPDGQEPRL